MNMESYDIKHHSNEAEFVGTSLLRAVERLADRRGDELDEVVASGDVLDATTTRNSDGVSQAIEFEAEYVYHPEGDEGFVYELTKSENDIKDFFELDDWQKEYIIRILESGQTDCDEHTTDSLLRLVQAYASGEPIGDEELLYRKEYIFKCRAEQLGNSMLVQRTMTHYLDNIVIGTTSIGNIDLDEEHDQEVKPGAEPTELEVDLSTSTHEDLIELHEMLQMLGLEKRK